jgi:hypothetical protein
MGNPAALTSNFYAASQSTDSTQGWIDLIDPSGGVLATTTNDTSLYLISGMAMMSGYLYATSATLNPNDPEADAAILKISLDLTSIDVFAITGTSFVAPAGLSGLRPNLWFQYYDPGTVYMVPPDGVVGPPFPSDFLDVNALTAFGSKLYGLGFQVGPNTPVVTFDMVRHSSGSTTMSYPSGETDRIAATPSGHLYVLTLDTVTSGYNYIYEWDIRTNTLINTLHFTTDVGGWPGFDAIAVAPDESVAYLSNSFGNNTVWTVDLTSGSTSLLTTLHANSQIPTLTNTVIGGLGIPIRQYPRDDNLALGAPRIAGVGPGQPSSGQNSLRQGFQGVYW